MDRRRRLQTGLVLAAFAGLVVVAGIEYYLFHRPSRTDRIVWAEVRAIHQLDDRLKEGDRSALDELIWRLRHEPISGASNPVAEWRIPETADVGDSREKAKWLEQHLSALEFDEERRVFYVPQGPRARNAEKAATAPATETDRD